MLRTLAFLGIAAVAYKQLDKRGSISRFKDDLKRRTDDLRSHIDSQRTSPAKADSSAGVTTAAI